ncbi:hypothetical protein TTHERM_01503040 (macronuclear) [Tetrahymena thermophila SB210]|uniref:Zinc finger lsd1 subclass family protein n=1 Tax=Tetrahymena thermophila (strain SB210) TaxID=312017 RepID=Q228S0_TETTS|nr:hypothetical protein TTHERM_01503040 [Tetrahymena thermophila SB210]EAR81786.2 hypothetical protein TTHERM_01503040 [Tetrahymena thermophila SB210]|eukprot:XP_001029449.2 hypothetical protein TTHERM_01503040 [Tetrahymena thermophila SB210]
MKALGFITGYYSTQQETYSLFLDFINNTNDNQKGFQIQFSTQSLNSISEININYIYFPEDQYYSGNSYYNIQSYNDSQQLNLNRFSFNISYTNGDGNQYKSTSQQQMQSFQVKNLQNTIGGINGFNFCGNKIDCGNSVRALLNIKNDNTYNYTTWSISQIYSITSQFIQFNMLNCNLINQTINFNDQCVNECPQKYFNNTDNTSQQLQVCSQCSEECQNCQSEKSKCITCKSGQYLYNNTCFKDQPDKTYCENKQFNYFICTECKNCTKYCDSNGQCLDCKNTYYFYRDKCQNELPPPNTYIDNGKYFDCHQTCKTCFQKGPNSCLSCDENNFIYQNNQCVCKDQKGLDQNFTCVNCKVLGCQNCTSDYTTCQGCQYDMILQNSICICSDQNYYFNQFKCIQSPNYKNCEKLNQFDSKCEQCKKGFQNYHGTCTYCGNGKYVASDNNCNGQCAQNCIFCLDSSSCQVYDQDLSCHFTCTTCTKPLSQNSCLGCISATRKLNNSTNTCDCIPGYEESGKNDCNKTEDPVKNYNQNTYSSPTAFEIVLIAILMIRQVLDTILSLNAYYMIFKSIQISRKKIPELNFKNELYMNNLPKEFDISTISQILDQSGKFQKSFKGQNY